MKKIIFFSLFLFSVNTIFGAHIIGGEMRYEYIGPSGANAKNYRLVLWLARGTSGATFAPSYVVAIYNNDNGQKVVGSAVNSNWTVNMVNPPGILPVPITVSPCIENAPVLNYTYASYSTNVVLPDNVNGYTVTYQTCCRQTGMANVFPTGSTYTCRIPGLDQLGTGNDNCPKFRLPINVICQNATFTLDFGANDADGDSLVYSFCSAFDGGAATDAGFANPAPPPYNSVSYISPFFGQNPLGANATINPQTGLISGIAPGFGKYVVNVCISEYRNGVLLTTHRKDLIVEVSNCTVAAAALNPDYISCDGFTLTFSNNVSNPGTTIYSWDFGDPASGINNTSTLSNPTHTYSDTGVYLLKLHVSLNGQCADSTTALVRVYPGFFPGFTNSQPLCANVPVQFTDTTSTVYGLVTGWNWDFGNPSVLNDTSHLKNPQYTYVASGTYNVQFIVANTKGCIDTLYKDIIISDPPPVNLFPGDTTYCGLDSLQLTATGIGNFNWSPAGFIIGANTGTPIVFPPVQTKYIVSLDNNGCISRDSVVITPRFDLLNSIAVSNNPICEEDTITLTGNSNYTSNLNWQWNPVATLENPVAKITKAYPIVNTTYNLTTTWGQHCIATTSIPIVVRPLAIPNAGPDAAICNGQANAQLNASGGATYQWTPATGLNNPNIANPIASPGTTTTYTVAVGVVGCSKTRIDSAMVTVRDLPALTITNDTLICSIDTLQLTGTGTGNFVWSPNYMIDNINAPGPLVSPDVPTKYFVRLTDGFGCHSDDSVFVDVKLFVTINAGNDTSLCRTDGFNLTTTSDALHYLWTPSTYLDDPTKKNPFTQPLTTTMYHVVGNIGKCQSEDSVLIKVVPYPPANAGTDRAICPGFNTQLFATGGSNYVWSPSTFLNDRFIANPSVLNPTASIRYIVTVTDTLGCPKPVKDTVFVTVFPKTIADAGPRDTSVVEGQPLQLNATGGLSYLWSPPQWLSSFAIPNPIALPQNTIEYIVEATSATGCKDTDSILIRLFKVDPDMYVPNAFTPNGDGINDVIRPILLGMKELRYFKIYNRLGQMVFYTTDIGKGWDGKFGGRGQDPGNFVWVAEGVTYKGLIKQKKGNVILIRQ